MFTPTRNPAGQSRQVVGFVAPHGYDRAVSAARPWIWTLLIGVAASSTAWAQAPAGDAEAPDKTPEPAESPSEDPRQVEARDAFLEGAEHAKNARWPQALTAFERAASIRSHPITDYNIGACERALGMYARARLTFQRALSSEELPDALRQKTQGFLKQIDDLLVELTVTVEPQGAAIAIDGRALVAIAETRASLPVQILSSAVSEKPMPVPGKAFIVLLDPGVHVLSVSRPGFAPAIVNRTFAPQQKVTLNLALDRLPATLSIRSSPPDAIVTVGDKDLGPTPLDVLRPAGRYDLLVEREGYLPYETQVDVTAGEQVNLHARLVEDEPSVFETWWFWTAAGAVVTGAVVGTYFAVRSDPEPTRTPLSGGTFGYTIVIP
jgi:PEGA domain